MSMCFPVTREDSNLLLYIYILADLTSGNKGWKVHETSKSTHKAPGIEMWNFVFLKTQ